MYIFRKPNGILLKFVNEKELSKIKFYRVEVFRCMSPKSKRKQINRNFDSQGNTFNLPINVYWAENS